MTRLSQRGRRLPSMFSSFRDVFSFRFSRFTAYDKRACLCGSRALELLPQGDVVRDGTPDSTAMQVKTAPRKTRRSAMF